MAGQGDSYWCPRVSHFPVDAVPDGIPVAGLLDDASVILAAIKKLGDTLRMMKDSLKQEPE